MTKDPSGQRSIAVVWEFEKTLSADCLQPLFARFGVDPKAFWRSVPQDTSYLNHILEYTAAELSTALPPTPAFRGLSNSLLYELGPEVSLYDGLPEFLERLNGSAEVAGWATLGIRVDHFIVSTGIEQIIRGSRICPYMSEIWGSEFDESPSGSDYPLFATADPTICGVRRSIDGTTKPRILSEMNSRTGKHTEISLQNTIYIDGSSSNVPAFGTVTSHGGRTFAVYEPHDAAQFQVAQQLQQQGLAHGIGEANYREGSFAATWITNEVRDLASRITDGRTVSETVGRPKATIGLGATTRPASPEFRRRAKVTCAPAPEDASWPTFAAACKRAIGTEFEKREADLRALHDNYVGSLHDRQLSAFMAEFETSSMGTPRGRQRHAAASDNSDFEKLLTFLERLYRKHKTV